MEQKAPVTLMQAVTAYLGSLEKEERAQAGPVLLHLVRWYGGDRDIRALSPADIERYRTQRTGHGDRSGKADPLRGFFSFAEREGMTEHDLAAALRSGRQSAKPTGVAGASAQTKKRPILKPGPSREEPMHMDRAESPRARATTESAPTGRGVGNTESTAIRCPACGESEALRGNRRADTIAVTCQRCGHSWERPLQPSCPRCGRKDLAPTTEPLVERVRGNQTAIVGARTVYRCPSCDR
jgi:DNA-directed RNA polymerase subunit M/transcription elongation factor TFIIS